MSDPGLRKRKKQLHKAPAEEDEQSPVTSLPRSKTRTLYALACLSAGLILYLFPGPVLKLLQSWVGTSQWEQEDLGANGGHIVNFSADVPKQNAVVAAFKHAWLAYERDAMGDDEYHPITRKGTNLTKAGGIGYTVVDSIDTMQLMGLTEEYQRAREWIANNMSLDRDANFNTFETTIRVLGGLLSAYHLSTGDPIFLERAKELADRMLPVFDTSSGLPLTMVNLAQRKGIPDEALPMLVSTAETATLQLEFRYLSFLTGKDDYWEKVERVMAVIKAARMPHGLASIFMTVDEGKFVTSAIRLGSRGDSFYEYLLKQYLQTNSTEEAYRHMYEDAMDAVHTHLIQETATHLVYTAELVPERNPRGEISWRRTPKQDHLVCFLGGSLMFGATTAGALVHPVSIPPRPSELTKSGQRDWKTGAELLKTCVTTHDTATGLSPEIVHFRIPSDGLSQRGGTPVDWYIKGAKPGEAPPYDARYILRPETIESLFIAFRLTGDSRYREEGWKIFQAIEKHCRVETGGYASVINVDEIPAKQEDKMETFLMSETLKYLYLLFSDASLLPLDKYVFNTEAHPLPIFEPTIMTGFS